MTFSKRGTGDKNLKRMRLIMKVLGSEWVDTCQVVGKSGLSFAETKYFLWVLRREGLVESLKPAPSAHHLWRLRPETPDEEAAGPR